MDVRCGSPSSSAIHQPDPKSLLLFFSRSKKSDGRRKAALTAASPVVGKGGTHTLSKGCGGGAKGRICQVPGSLVPLKMKAMTIRGLIQLGKNPGENPGENPDENPGENPVKKLQ